MEPVRMMSGCFLPRKAACKKCRMRLYICGDNERCTKMITPNNKTAPTRKFIMTGGNQPYLAPALNPAIAAFV